MYRDDLEAATARIAALEEELRELREKDAAQADIEQVAAVLAKARKPAKKKRGFDPFSGWGLVIAIAGCVVFGLALAGIAQWRERRKEASSRSRGSLHAAFWVKTAVGDRVLAVEEATYQGRLEQLSEYHLSALDPASGEVGPRVETPFQIDYIGRTTAGLWFRDWGQLGLHRRNDRTLAVQVTQADWLAKNPALHGKLEILDVVDREGRIGLMDDQARYFWLDGDTLIAEPTTSKPKVGSGQLPVQIDSDSGWASTAPGDVVKSAKWIRGDRSFLHCEGQDASSEALLKPHFLSDQGSYSRWLTGPDSLLVIHATSLGSGSPLLLSRLPCQGPPLWSVPLGATEVAAAFVRTYGVVVITHSETGDDATMLDLDNGHARWHHAY